MKKNLLDLADILENKVEEIEKAASDIAVDAAFSIVENLAFRTPVDTSKALSNWLVDLDKSRTSEIPPHYPGLLGSTYLQSAQETLNLASLVLNDKKPGQAIFISNNTDYIKKLNEGTSSQAPAGFVEMAVLIGFNVFKKFKLKG